MPLNRTNFANVRSIFEVSAESGEIADCLAERGRFEPPVPRRLLWAELGPNLAHYSARKKASVLERICSPGIRRFFGSLWFPSFAGLMRGNSVTKAPDFESPPLGRAVSNSLATLDLHEAVFAAMSVQAQCAMESKRREEWLQRLCAETQVRRGQPPATQARVRLTSPFLADGPPGSRFPRCQRWLARRTSDPAKPERIAR